MPEVVANGIKQHYQLLHGADDENPRNRPVVFVHGLGWDNLTTCYFTVAHPLAASGRDVLVYDLRGHGKSERVRAGYSVEEFTDDLAALIDGVGLTGPVHLVGLSFGGAIAMTAAARHPRLAASVTFVEAHTCEPGWAKECTDFIRTMDVALEDPNILAWLAEQADRRTRRIVDNVRFLFRETTLIADVECARAVDPAELIDAGVPVLGVYGGRGELLPRGEYLREAFPGARVEVLDGRTHTVISEAPAEVAAILRGFFRETESESEALSLTAHQAVGAST